jgi:hypothetical protein
MVKTINVTLSDEEHKELNDIKAELSWRDAILKFFRSFKR